MGDRERNKKRLLELLQAAGTGNGHCADCGAAGKGAMCGAGAASPGPWPTGCFPRSPSTRDSDSLLAWDPSPSRWRVSGDPDGPPSPCSRSPGPQSSLRIRCGPCPGSLLLSHPALTTQDPALDTISDPGPFPRPRTLRSSPRCLLGLRDPHCRAMTEDADVAGSGAPSLRAGPSLTRSPRFPLPRSPGCRRAKGWAKHDSCCHLSCPRLGTKRERIAGVGRACLRRRILTVRPSLSLHPRPVLVQLSGDPALPPCRS